MSEKDKVSELEAIIEGLAESLPEPEGVDERTLSDCERSLLEVTQQYEDELVINFLDKRESTESPPQAIALSPEAFQRVKRRLEFAPCLLTPDTPSESQQRTTEIPDLEVGHSVSNPLLDSGSPISPCPESPHSEPSNLVPPGSESPVSDIDISSLFDCTDCDMDELQKLLCQQLKTSNLNNYQKLTGIRHFYSVGVEVHPDHPGIKFEPSASEWIKQLEAQTPFGDLWDNKGRQNAAEMYVVGPATRQVRHLRQANLDWDDFKKQFMELHPEVEAAVTALIKISTITRVPGETLTHLAMRLNDLTLVVKENDPALEERAKQAATQQFLAALPKKVVTKFVKKGDYFVTYLQDVVNYFQKNTSYGLDAESVAKEKTASIKAVKSESGTVPKKNKGKEKSEGKAKEKDEKQTGAVLEGSRGKGPKRGGQVNRGNFRGQARGRGAANTFRGNDFRGRARGNYNSRGGRGRAYHAYGRGYDHRNRQGSGYSYYSFPGTCFRCHQQGHRAFECMAKIPIEQEEEDEKKTSF